ncbi:hypothetical protein [Malaciobacter halophilus]|uniref:hypothetical protein n=1 Tax=Malaciobacter halophilus TaxID=197482 RepID=UPI002ADF622B|nr:hypothetical protein [Malaciobacter halophilus]
MTQDCLNNELTINYICNNNRKNYYYSDDFSIDFYIKAAYEGFISISFEQNELFVILPEMQFDYAVLHFENLHISKKVKKLLDKKDYEFSVNKDFKTIINKINEYHLDSWIVKEYKNTLLNLENYQGSIDFELLTCSLKDKESNEIIAGEIGYRIGKVYTSLSGFSSKKRKFNNYGKLQLVLLAQYLEEKGFNFWNLGHPYMKYKFDLGAVLYKREEFLNIFREQRDKKLNS